MPKSRIFIILTIVCALVLVATGLFACGPKDVVPEDGRVVAVATAMDTVYAAMVASDEPTDPVQRPFTTASGSLSWL